MTNGSEDKAPDVAVNAYRIEQLEKQLEALRSSTKTLSLEQLKQMGLWLGLPVAIATGIFGLALWQTIETSAGNRAAAEVQKIAGDIERLETRSTEMARNAESRFGNLREISGRAEEAARGVRLRADEAREQAAEAERLLTSLRQELARVPEVQTLLQDTGSIASDLAKNPVFQNTVASQVLDSLAGSVIAFDKECPVELGWVPFDPAQGRMVVGVGSTADDRGETREFLKAGLAGGAFQHVLTISEMPSHNHALSVGQRGAGGPNTASWNLVGIHPAMDLPPTSTRGGGEPHNNMPPYITLHFCKKEAG